MQKVLAVSLWILVMVGIASAQSPTLALGTVGRVTPLSTCPSGYATGAKCFQVTVSCPNTADVKVNYGYVNPSGTPRGTIVEFSGGGGTAPYGSETTTSRYNPTYLRAGYQIVQTSWATDWEDTGISGAKDLKAAACRPATLLNYLHQKLYVGNGGMCAQGFSAGSGALGYGMAWYGMSDYLDKVELLSGPVFSDVEKGCAVPDFPAVTVCANGRFGCVGSPWIDAPQYVQAGAQLVESWTGHACQQNKTSSTTNAIWKAMSIVDGTTGPNFQYPKTAIAAWLCGNGLNNSAAEGDLFYQNLTRPSQVSAFSETRIDGCSGAEGVDAGTTPSKENGFVAITADMTDPVVGCLKRH